MSTKRADHPCMFCHIGELYPTTDKVVCCEEGTAKWFWKCNSCKKKIHPTYLDGFIHGLKYEEEVFGG